MTLQEIEQNIQQRLLYLSQIEESPIAKWMDAYRTLAQVKQAIDVERVATALENILSVMPRER